MTIIRLLLSVLLAALAGWLFYTLFLTVKEPIDFQKQKDLRDQATIERFKSIRKGQLIYKNIHGNYASTFDSLAMCLKNDSIKIQKIIGDPNDSTVVSRTEIVQRSILDSLFSGNPKNIDSLELVPFNTSGAKFAFESGYIEKNEVAISVFQASVPYTTLYKGMVPKYYAHLKDGSMRVGNLKDGSTAGNWEK